MVVEDRGWPLRLIESTPSLRARLHEKRAHWRQQVSDALRRRPGAELDPFTADLLTIAATAALDTVSGEWLRSGGTADRAVLLDRAFTLIRPASRRLQASAASETAPHADLSLIDRLIN